MNMSCLEAVSNGSQSYKPLVRGNVVFSSVTHRFSIQFKNLITNNFIFQGEVARYFLFLPRSKAIYFTDVKSKS